MHKFSFDVIIVERAYLFSKKNYSWTPHKFLRETKNVIFLNEEAGDGWELGSG